MRSRDCRYEHESEAHEGSEINALWAEVCSHFNRIRSKRRVFHNIVHSV